MSECCGSMSTMDTLGAAVIHSVWLMAAAGVFTELLLTRFTTARSRCTFLTLSVILMPMVTAFAYIAVQASWLPSVRLAYFASAAATTWVACVFVTGVTIQLLRLVTAIACVFSLRQMNSARSIIPIPGYLCSLQLSPIRIVRSSGLAGPVTVGWLRPVILIPEHTLLTLTANQILLLVRHEAAHISHRDYLWNLIQRLVESFVFYHPTVWFLGQTLRQEREFACDDSVVRSGVSRLEYSKALTSLEQLRFQWNPLLQPSDGAPLRLRIQRLLTDRSVNHLSVLRTLVCVLIAATGASLNFASTAAMAPVGGQLAGQLSTAASATSNDDWSFSPGCVDSPSTVPTTTAVSMFVCPESPTFSPAR